MLIKRKSFRAISETTRLFKVLLIVILTINAMMSCSTTQNEPGNATVTINLRAFDDGSIIGASVMLQCNSGNIQRVFRRYASSNEVSFTDVEFGTYTLIISHQNYRQHINGNIEVRARNVNHGVMLISEGMDVLMFNIQNNTGRAIHTLRLGHYGEFTGNLLDSDGFHWGYYTFITGNTFTLIRIYECCCDWSPSELDIRLIDTNDNRFTKRRVPIYENAIITFTMNDRDGAGIEHLFDVVDRDRFDFVMFISTDWGLELLSFINVAELFVRINGTLINLFRDGGCCCCCTTPRCCCCCETWGCTSWCEPLGCCCCCERVGDYWWGDFNFSAGGTYQVRLTTIEPDFDITLSHRVAQNIHVNWPKTIGPGAIRLDWLLSPNNNIHNNFSWLEVLSGPGRHFQWDDFIAPSLRVHTFPAGFIPLANIGGTRISFDIFNYAVAGRVSTVSGAFTSAQYRDGALHYVWHMSLVGEGNQRRMISRLIRESFR